MSVVAQPINSWYNGQPYLSTNWIDNVSNLNNINDNGYLNVSGNTTLTDASVSNVLTLSNPLINIGTPNIGNPQAIGYALAYVGNTQAMTSTTYNSLKIVAIPIGCWVICAQVFQTIPTTGGTITQGAYGVSLSNTTITQPSYGAYIRTYTNQLFSVGDTPIYTTTFIYSTASAINLYIFAQITFASGTFGCQGACTIVKIA